MARAILSAASAEAMANSAGPAPEIEQPCAPASRAARFTSAKPGMSLDLTGSTTRSTTARPKSATLPCATAATRAAAFAQLPAASLREIISGRTDRA
jgi:hypothetical protein